LTARSLSENDLFIYHDKTRAKLFNGFRQSPFLQS